MKIMMIQATMLNAINADGVVEALIGQLRGNSLYLTIRNESVKYSIIHYTHVVKMSKQKGLEIFWLNSDGGEAEVHINKFAKRNIDIQITDVKKDLFYVMAKSFGFKVQNHTLFNNTAVWFEFARARDGSKVTVFCEDESQ